MSLDCIRTVVRAWLSLDALFLFFVLPRAAREDKDMVQSRHGPTAHAASLTSLLPCLMPWEPRESTWESYDHGLLRASTPSKYSGPTGHRRSTFRCCCYSGAKSWAVLLIWAHSPPMVVYRTAIVQGLSIAHGQGEGRQFSPVKSEVFSIRLNKGYTRGPAG